MVNNLKKLRESLGFTHETAAEKMGVSRSQFIKLERGERRLTLEYINRAAKAFSVSPADVIGDGEATVSATSTHSRPRRHATNVQNLPILGTVQAGSFRDISLISYETGNLETIPVAEDPRYSYAKQYALRVAGDSMNKVFSEGEFVTCAEWANCGLELKPGMILHVERVIAGSLIETTVKRYAVRDGKRWLDPDSTNPKHQPIEVNGNEDTEILIRGIVTGAWKPISF